MRRDKWDELYAGFKEDTDKEHDEVVALGGLHIVATERHESRRIDNQLRGRAGRQGDPGSSRFFLSLQDDLLRIFGGEKMQNLMLRLGMEEDVPIESKMITNRIAKRRKRWKRRISRRANTCWNTTTSTTSSARRFTACGGSCWKAAIKKSACMEMVQGIVEQFIDRRCPDDKHPDTWDLATLRNDILTQFGHKIDLSNWPISTGRRWRTRFASSCSRSTRRRKTWWGRT